MQACIPVSIQALTSWPLCVWGKRWSKLLWRKAMCYNALVSSKPEFPQEIENHSLKVTILLAPLHKKLHFLPNWLQRERLFHLVLRKAHNYLSFVICEMKGLCLAQRQALLWMHCRSFFIVLLKIFISNLSHFLYLTTKAQPQTKQGFNTTKNPQLYFKISKHFSFLFQTAIYLPWNTGSL